MVCDLQAGSEPAGTSAASAGLRQPGRRLGLAGHLAGLVLAVLLPALALGAATAWHLTGIYRSAFEERLSDTTRALALALDSEFEVFETAATALATSPLLRRDDLGAFRAWATAATAHLGGWVIVNDAGPGHRQLLNTMVPEGTLLPEPPPARRPGQGADEVIERALATGRPAISNLFRGRASGRAVTAVAAPAPRAGAVVVVALDPGRLALLLAEQDLSGGAVAAVADGRNRIVARSRGQDRFLAVEAPGRTVTTAVADAGMFEAPNAEGTPSLYAFRKLRRASGWAVVVTEPLAAYRAGWTRPLLALLGGGTAALGLGLVLAMALGRRIRRPVSALLQRAEAVAAGAASAPPAALPPSAVAEFEALRAAVERADAALRAGEAEFRAAFEQSVAPMLQTDCATGRFLRVNAAFAQLVGRSQQDLVGRPFSEVTHPDDRAADLAGFWRMARGEAPSYQADKRFVRPDGTVRWVRITSSPIRDAAGRPLRTIAVLLDVTERREAEAALRQSEARLELATSAAEIGIWDWDVLENSFVYSPRAKAICGFAPDQDVTYEDVRRVTHPEDLPHTSAAARRALDPTIRGHSTFEYRVVHPDGSLRRVVAHGEAVFAVVDGEERAVRFAGTLQDVTERWRLEEQRAASEARLRLAVDAGRMAVWDADLTRDSVTGSPELNRLLGFPPEASPTFEEMRTRYFPGERERLRAIGQAALSRGKRFFEAEFRYLWPDGSLRWLLLRAEIHLDAAGQPVKAIGVLLDMTDRKRTEEALRESEAGLRLAQEAGGVGVWDMDLAAETVRWSPELYALLGLDPGQEGPMSMARSLELVHPDDRAAVEAAWAEVLTTGVLTTEFRMLRRAPGGATEERWMLSRGRHLEGSAGAVGRIFGVNVDITDRKRAEERQRLLAREVDHRAKNALAVVQAALRLTPKGDAATYARAIEGRVNALARVHSLLAAGRWAGAELKALAEGELAPFLLPQANSPCPDAPRVELRGPAMLLGPTAAQALSMALHELATNATKHGALSRPAGLVRLSWQVDHAAGVLRLRWAEEGGPAVPAPPARRGFGSRVMEATVCDQLGGAVRREWAPGGLVCDLEIALRRLGADLGGGTEPARLGLTTADAAIGL